MYSTYFRRMIDLRFLMNQAQGHDEDSVSQPPGTTEGDAPERDWRVRVEESAHDLDASIPHLAGREEAFRVFKAQALASTEHRLFRGDARNLGFLAAGSLHLVLTSPPYWTLKEYNPHPAQLGHVPDYDQFLDELDKVWRECHRVLVPGGRLICVVGDVCLPRRKVGRHLVMPLHSDIAVRCRRIGFDNLTPIFWHKITNASYEVENGSKFFGKPYEPNAILKNDVEFVLMQRKPGGYRKPTPGQRRSISFRKHCMTSGSSRPGTFLANRPRGTLHPSPSSWHPGWSVYFPSPVTRF